MKTFRNTVLRLALLPVLLFSVSLQEGKAQTDPALEAAVSTGFFETLANQLENLEQMQLTYEEIMNGNDIIRSVYSASKFLTSSPQVSQLYGEIESYNTMVEMLYTDMKRYASDPDMDPALLARTARLLNSSQQMVTQTIENTMQLAFMEKGLSYEERLNRIKEAISELLAHKGLISRHIEGLKRFKKEKKMDPAPTAATVVYHQSLSTKKSGFTKPADLLELQTRETGQVLTEEQEKIAQEVLRNANNYRKQKDNYTVDKIVETKNNTVRTVINITSLVVGLIAAAIGAMAYARRQRGERQVNDAIYKWLIGILFFIFALQIVKILIA